MKFPSEPHSPNEDVVINFQTDNLYGGDNQTMARTNTGGEGHLLSRVTTMGQGQGERLLTPVEDIMPPNLLEEETIMRLINNSVFYILRIKHNKSNTVWATNIGNNMEYLVYVCSGLPLGDRCV